MRQKDKPPSAQNLHELFDVVNERDEVVGQATRGEVHARGLWHRAVHVFVFDRAGRLFLQKRSLAKDKSPGLWDASCSGHVDAGETYDAAAQRELGEELGLQVAAPPVRWLRMDASEPTGWEFIWVYRMSHDGPFVLNPHEIDRGEWHAVAQIRSLMESDPERFTRPFREIWSKVAIEL
jgi:isopentenyl-diphosphate delta-isomerase